MSIHRTALVLLLVATLPGHAIGAAAQDPAADCYRSAASGSDEPLACDLAVQVATRTGDSWTTAAAYTNRGIVLARGGRLELALKDHDAALALQPQMFPALLNRAHVLLRLGRFADALRAYDVAAAAEPDSSVVYLNRVFAQLGLGNTSGAETDLAQAGALAAEQLRRQGRYRDNAAGDGTPGQ